MKTGHLLGLGCIAVLCHYIGCVSNVDGGSDEPCVVTGCSSQVCADENVATTCEWTEAYACFQNVGICERDAAGSCGWRQTPELEACLSNANRVPVSGNCIRNAGDTCTEDADCTNGGCGGELCHNPSLSEGITTCDCTQPQGINCGCVGGTCTWWQ